VARDSNEKGLLALESRQSGLPEKQNLFFLENNNGSAITTRESFTSHLYGAPSQDGSFYFPLTLPVIN
jgi:hypothetical protein